LGCSIMTKLEIYRKEDEVITLINSTTILEKKAIARGNFNTSICTQLSPFQ
jgi:hypothetical protein